MVIRDKLRNKFGKKKEESIEEDLKENPEEFESNEERIQEGLDELGPEKSDIQDFLKKKNEQKAEKLKAKEKKEVEEEPEEQEIVPKETEPDKLRGSLTNYLDLRVTSENFEKTKEVLVEALDSGFVLALQAGIKVEKENVVKVSAALKYLVTNGYLVVVSGEKSEPVFDEK